MSVTDIDTHMGHTLSVCILQKYQIAGLQIRFGNIGSNLDLLGCGSRKINAALVKYILNKAGAIKTLWRGSAPNIRGTQMFLGIGDDLLYHP